GKGKAKPKAAKRSRQKIVGGKMVGGPADGAKVTDGTAKAPRAPAGGSKVALIAAMLTRPEGCTTAEVLEATKWPTVSMPHQAKAGGLALRKVKEGKASRYYGSPIGPEAAQAG